MDTKNRDLDALAEVKKFFSYAFRYWYLFVITLVIALAYAFYQNRYTNRVYPVGMSVYIKERPGLESSAALLYGNSPLAQYNPNYYNEPYLLRADPLMEKVVRKLDLHLSFYKEGRLKTSEIYPGPPITIIAENEHQMPYGERFLFKLNDKESFYLKPYNEEDKNGLNQKNLFKFGQLINSQFSVLSKKNVESFDGELILVIQDPKHVGYGYGGRMSIDWAAEGASLLNLQLSGINPQKEVDFLEGLIDTYIEENVEQKTENASRTIAFIDEQIGYITDSLSRIEARMEQFKQSTNVGDISLQTQNLLTNLQNLETQQSEYLVQLKYFDYVKKYVESERNEGDAVVPSSIGISDPILNTMVADLVQMQVERNQLVLSSQIENPYVKPLEAKIANMKESILENVSNQRANLLINKKDLDKRISKFENELKKLPAAERKFVNIQRVFTLSEDLYLFLMRKKAEAGINKASTTAGIQVVNPPKVIGGAISPNINKNYMTALGMGLGLPILFLFVLFLLNDKIKYKEEIAGLTKIPLLGSVGHNNFESSLVVVEKPRSAVSESFRSLRTNLQFFTSHKQELGCKIFLLTSSVSGEGKTFCSINLASVFAISGKKTLLIGADMRRPKIFEDFKLPNDVGLSNFLAGVAKQHEIIQTTSVQNLDLISGGTIPPNPSELLIGPQIKSLITYLKEIYDVIIIDTPPIGLVADGFSLMEHADHTIFLVRHNYSKNEYVKNLDELVTAGKINNVSIILNDVKVGSYGYAYGKRYGYGSNEYYEE